MNKKIWLFMFSTLFSCNAYADVLTHLKEDIMFPIAIHDCRKHVSKYVSKTKTNDLCYCAWGKIVNHHGEANSVLKQVMDHSDNKRLRRLEHSQIMACVRQYHVNQPLTKAEKHSKKLYKWMH